MKNLTAPLNTAHKKENFDCGILLLNQYLHMQAKQDVKRKLSACFILADADNIVKGYYTLSSTSIKRETLPEQIIKKLPPTYYNLPATLLGRLAVDNKFKGQKIGALLLIDALKKCYESSLTSIGSMCVIVDPIDDNATQFYKKFGFVLLPDSGKMFIPMLTIGELFK
jgi:predicted GNAT family N-acyltransferase